MSPNHTDGNHQQPIDEWDLLPDEKKQDLIDALEEIKHPENLVPQSEAMKQARQWISKSENQPTSGKQ